MKVNVRVIPPDRELKIKAGDNLRDALIEAGIPLDSPCGGQGTCLKCKVQLSRVNHKFTKLEQEKLKLEAEKLKLQAEIEKLRLEMGMTIDTKSQERQIAAMEKAERLRLERERLDLERAKFAHQSGMDVAKHRHQADIDWAGMAQGDAGNSY